MFVSALILPDGKRGEFAVRELGDAEAVPASAKPMDITPLPENWYPAQ